MRLHVLQHVDFETEGAVAEWADLRGHSIGRSRLFANGSLPDLESIDLLVVMGGPMNIYQEREHPFLVEEKAFLRRAVSGGKRVLGVCLGAQLLADVLGGPVSRGTREIGFHRVELAPRAREASVFRDFPASFFPYHWHGDTFRIPEGAVHAAASAGCASQAFVWRERVVGIQFHLEATVGSVEALIAHCAAEITPGPHVQSAEEMREGAGRHLAPARALLFRLLDRLEALGPHGRASHG